jgi:hypothetical protein
MNINIACPGYSDKLPANLARAVADAIIHIDRRNGFAMYGEFFSHQENWLFPKEQPSVVFAEKGQNQDETDCMMVRYRAQFDNYWLPARK